MGFTKKKCLIITIVVILVCVLCYMYYSKKDQGYTGGYQMVGNSNIQPKKYEPVRSENIPNEVSDFRRLNVSSVLGGISKNNPYLRSPATRRKFAIEVMSSAEVDNDVELGIRAKRRDRDMKGFYSTNDYTCLNGIYSSGVEEVCPNN
jgi:hypothetical protein